MVHLTDELGGGRDVADGVLPAPEIGVETSFADTLLAALVAMAVHSKRRQADMSAALRRAGLVGTPEQLRDALKHLRLAGMIQEIVPLYDGGVLVSITSQGMDQPGRSDQWAFLSARSRY